MGPLRPRHGQCLPPGQRHGRRQQHQGKQGQRQHIFQEIPNGQFEPGVQVQVLRVPDGRQHAAQVRRYGLQDHHMDQPLRLSCHLQGHNGKGDKCDQRNIIRDEHTAEKAQRHQQKAKLPGIPDALQKPGAQIPEEPDALQACHHQHQAEQQGQHPVIRILQIPPVRRHEAHGARRQDGGDAEHGLFLEKCDDAAEAFWGFHWLKPPFP